MIVPPVSNSPAVASETPKDRIRLSLLPAGLLGKRLPRALPRKRILHDVAESNPFDAIANCSLDLRARTGVRLPAFRRPCIMTASMESHCISFREIPHTSKLFSSFVDDFESVVAYYAHPPTAQGIAAAAGEVRLDPAVRQTVVEILREQNRRFAPGQELGPEVRRNLDRLAAGAAAIVTGQQVGLFSGPAYTFYKALSAARVSTDASIDAVPIFWLATEDHDLAEVNHSSWATRNGLARYELPAAEADAGHHVGQVRLGDAIQAIVATAAQTLEGPFAEEVARALRESYASGETYGSAFGKLMARFLAPRGIIFIDPFDARLHRACASVYRRAIEDAAALTDALLVRSQELESRGFHAQVKVTRETTLLFFDVQGRREPVRLRNGKFSAGRAEFSREELLAELEKAPEAFTPSALLRPVVQDSLLPTAAYFGGPAEVAYWAQSQVVYQHILGRMPAVLPRASFTLVTEPLASLPRPLRPRFSRPASAAPSTFAPPWSRNRFLRVLPSASMPPKKICAPC